MSDGMIIGLCLLGTSLILALADMICIIVCRNKRKRCRVESEATVVDEVCRRTLQDDETRYYYCPVYEYWYNGVTYKNESRVGTSAHPEIGKRRMIYINPDNPEELMENGVLMYLHIIIVTVIAGIFGLAGLICFLSGIL